MDNVYHAAFKITAISVAEDFNIELVPVMDTSYITKSKLSLRLSSATLKRIFLPEEKLALQESDTTN
jgi:hypothetical protein